jgi:hypothetical protein
MGGTPPETKTPTVASQSAVPASFQVSKRFERSFPFQYARATIDESKGRIFLALFKDNEVQVLDGKTGATQQTFENLDRPEWVSFDRLRNVMLVALGDSRQFVVVPDLDANKEFEKPTGLNPVWVGGTPDTGYFLLAGGVHILYRLDRVSYASTDWVAIGDAVQDVSLDASGKRIYLPLKRKGKVRIVELSTLRILSELDMDPCEAPRKVVPVSVEKKERLAVLCKDGLYLSHADASVAKRVWKFRHRPGSMVSVVMGNFLVISFPKVKELDIWDLERRQVIKRMPLAARPIFLASTSDGMSFLVITNSARAQETKLVSYRVLSPVMKSKTVSVPAGKIPEIKQPVPKPTTSRKP